MTKSPKNRRPQRPRSRSPQVNVGAQRTPTNPVQRVMADTASAFSTGVRRAFDSDTKIMRQNKQDTSATVQQDDASTAMQQDVTSMTVNAPSVNTPDGRNSKNNDAQEHGIMDLDASFLSDFRARASQVGANTTNEFSPIGNQVASPIGNIVASGINFDTPPRQNSSGDNVTVTGIDLLDTQNTTASSDSVVGTHVPVPSPRRSTQSPATHQLQQTLRNNASEQVRRHDSSSSARSNDSGDTASAFSAFGANDPPTIVETAQDGSSDDGDGWPEGEGLVGNLAGNNTQVNLIPRSSGACDEIGMAYDSAVALAVNTAGNTAENIVIDAKDPGRGDFVISVGALGNASGAPLDGSQNVSFGEDMAEERCIVDSAAKSAASRRSCKRGGMKVDNRSESSASYDAPPNVDPSDPKALADLLTRPPEPNAHSPTLTTQFNEQTGGDRVCKWRRCFHCDWESGRGRQCASLIVATWR